MLSKITKTIKVQVGKVQLSALRIVVALKERNMRARLWLRCLPSEALAFSRLNHSRG